MERGFFGSRRYQLMLQAYRRGLLRENLPFGARSRLRERVLLDSLDAEGVARSSWRSVQAAAQIVGGADLDGQARRRLLDDIDGELDVITAFERFDLDEVRALRSDSSLAVETIYGVLSAAGMVGESPDDASDR